MPSLGGTNNPRRNRIKPREKPAKGPAAATFKRSSRLATIFLILVIAPKEPICHLKHVHQMSKNQNSAERMFLFFQIEHCIFTCQLGTKNGTPSFIPKLFATKMCPSSCTPRTRVVTRAPGKPSFSSSRLSNADLQLNLYMRGNVLFSLMIWKYNIFWRKHVQDVLTVSWIARRAHYGETM